MGRGGGGVHEARTYEQLRLQGSGLGAALLPRPLRYFGLQCHTQCFIQHKVTGLRCDQALSQEELQSKAPGLYTPHSASGQGKLDYTRRQRKR